MTYPPPWANSTVGTGPSTYAAVDPGRRGPSAPGTSCPRRERTAAFVAGSRRSTVSSRMPGPARSSGRWSPVLSRGSRSGHRSDQRRRRSAGRSEHAVPCVTCVAPVCVADSGQAAILLRILAAYPHRRGSAQETRAGRVERAAAAGGRRTGARSSARRPSVAEPVLPAGRRRRRARRAPRRAAPAGRRRLPEPAQHAAHLLGRRGGQRTGRRAARSRRWRPGRRRTARAGAPRASTPAAASRPCRMTDDLPAEVGGGAGRDQLGHRGQRTHPLQRATDRTRATSRSRWKPGVLEPLAPRPARRSGPCRRVDHRGRVGGDAAAGRRRRARRTRSTDSPVAGQARRAAAAHLHRARRPPTACGHATAACVHCRSGIASWTAAITSSAVRVEENGPR